VTSLTPSIQKTPFYTIFHGLGVPRNQNCHHQNCPASKQSWKYVKYRNFRIVKPSVFKPFFFHETLCDASQSSLVRPSNVLRIVKQTLLVVIFLLALAHPVLHPVPRLVVILHGSYVIGWKEEDVAVD
jgi:hypothetical protein